MSTDISPNVISKDEAIRRIEQVYGAQANPDNLIFDVYDQLWVCENLAAAEEKERTIIPLEPQKETDREPTDNVSVNGNGNDTRKQRVNFELTDSKLKVITELEKCNYKTPPIQLAHLLEEFFKDHPSKKGHWMYISQKWNPRAINRVLRRLIKFHITGSKTIQNPPGLFNQLINMRKTRRGL